MPFSLGGGSPGIETTGISVADDGALDGFWYIDHLDHDFSVLQTIRPENLHFTMRESDVSDIDYEISRGASDVYGNPAWYKNDDGTAFIAPFRTGWRLRFGTFVIMEGFHADPGTNYEWGSEVLTVAGKDYVGYLALRHYPFDPRDGHVDDFNFGDVTGLVYQIAGGDFATIMDAILGVVFAQDGSIPITWTFAPTGQTQDFEMDLGDTTDMLTFVQNFVNQYPGVEFNITPDREMQLASPKFYGSPDDVVVDPDLYWTHKFDDTDPTTMPGLESLSFNNIGPKWTHFLGTGAGISEQEATAIDYPPGFDEFWRIDGTLDFGNVKNQDQVTTMSRGQLAFGLNPVHQIVITVLPEYFDNFWEIWIPGQVVYLRIDLGWHLIDSPHEIIEMDVTVANTGEAAVQITLNQIYSVSDGEGGFEGNPQG